ncbi:MAG TPA: hypothetical protein QGI71_09775 [Dehalococcoidia bacterium]|nr:hypothetical protein [Dehalococcoidia bacterium]
MTALDNFLAANEHFAAEPAVLQLPTEPARKVAILTFMDARLARGAP